MRLRVTPPSSFQLGEELSLVMDLAREIQMATTVRAASTVLFIHVESAEREEMRKKVRAALRERGFEIVAEE